MQRPGPSQNQIIFAILIVLNDIQGAISRRDTANRIQGILIVDEIRHVAASQIFPLHSINNTALELSKLQAIYYELIDSFFSFSFYHIAVYFILLHNRFERSNLQITKPFDDRVLRAIGKAKCKEDGKTKCQTESHRPRNR